MSEKLELFVKDLKAKFEDLEQMVYNDEEYLTLKEISHFLEELLELLFEMIKAIRINRFNTETLSHLVDAESINKLVKENRKKSDEKKPDFFI